jgi:hypothetical protein
LLVVALISLAAKDKPDRYTTPEEYEANLIRMIGDVRRKGGNPILCTTGHRALNSCACIPRCL